jgi:V8-like Glu-specific endopeptidase
VRAVERASSVCLIEVPKIKRQGTGFLIGEALVLTNYHVLYTAEEDLEANARETVFNFGKISTAPGQPPAGQSFRAASGQSIVRSSTVDQLDYVLLRVDDSIRGAKEIKPAPFTTQMPYKRMGLNILQHPEGETMKLALSSNGVVEVFPERGLVQYTTRAEGGSSGAPCFTNDWQVIALHHAERSKAFGVVREGIIFEAIHKEIAAFL